MNKRILMIGSAIVVVVAIGAAIAAWMVSDSAEADPVIATVDGVAIHESAAASRIEGIAAVHGSTDAIGTEWRWMVMQSLIDDVIMQQEVERAGLEPTADDIETEVESLRSRFGEDGSWDDFLDEQGMTSEEMERRVELQMVGARAYESITGDIAPTEDEVRTFYEDNIETYTVDGEPLPFLEVRNSIESELTKQMRDTVYVSWLAEKRESVVVVVVSDEWK